MVSAIVRNRVVFYASLMSICWESTVSMVLSLLLQFYYAHIHTFATQIIKIEFFGFSNAEDLDFMPDHEQCPASSVSIIGEVGSASEKEKPLHNIKKWDLARIFHALDTNRDGMVTADDIQCLLEKLGLLYYCDDSMKIMVNYPEHMGFEDFYTVCLSLLGGVKSPESTQALSEKKELKEAFRVFDKDGDGFTTPSELQHVLLSLGLREAQVLENCEAMVAKFDKNADGRIDFAEFENMMTMINRSQ